MPSRAMVDRWLNETVGFGLRLTGTRAHNEFIDFLDHGFREAGLVTHRDRYLFTQWLAKSWSLTVLEGKRAGRVPVASYYTYCGATPAHGVTGKLVYLGVVPPPSLSGNPLNVVADQAALARAQKEIGVQIAQRLSNVAGGVKGAIVLMDVVIPPVPFGALLADATYVYDPKGTLPTEDYKRAALLLGTIPNLEPFAAAGAAGVVFSLDASAANAAGQYAPFIYGLQGTPSLLVDRDTGSTLRDVAAYGGRVNLILTATMRPKTSTDTLWAVLPGETDEIMIVNTHTDGPNIIEENGGVVELALAKHFASLPRSARKRTMIFSCVTGHFASEVPSTPGWITNHQDLVKRTAAAIAVEHYGAREWIDDPVLGYRPSGLIEPSLDFHSVTPIAAYAARSISDHDIDRSALLRPVGMTFFGEGAPLHESGIPTVGIVPGPNYLLSFNEDQHIDKLDRAFLYRQILWTADLLHRLDGVPADVLKAGDSTVLPSQLGGTLPIE